MATGDERQRLFGVYHAVLREIASQVPLQVTSRRIAELAFKEWFRARIHPGVSITSLSNERLKLVTQEIEAIACTEMGVTFHGRAS